MAKTVYLVTHGEYSDYKVHGVYSTRRKAAYAQKLFAADRIEAFELDAVPSIPRGFFHYGVTMKEDGTGKSVLIYNVEYYDPEEKWNPAPPDAVDFQMLARNEKQAVKIANERRVQLIANNLFVTDWDDKRWLRYERSIK